MKPNDDEQPAETWIPLTEASETMELTTGSDSERHTIAGRILLRGPTCGLLLGYLKSFAAKFLKVQLCVRVDRPDWWPPARANRRGGRPPWGWATQLRAEVQRESPKPRTVTLSDREIGMLLPTLTDIAMRHPEASVRGSAQAAASALLAGLPAELREVCEQEVLAALAPPVPVEDGN